MEQNTGGVLALAACTGWCVGQGLQNAGYCTVAKHRNVKRKSPISVVRLWQGQAHRLAQKIRTTIGTKTGQQGL